MARKQKTITKTYREVLLSTPGSARLVIEDAIFGARFLGGEEFCVFANENEARRELGYLKAAGSGCIDEFEIHVLMSNGLWLSKAAGTYESVAPDYRYTPTPEAVNA